MAASALSGGFAYRLVFWIFPFGLVTLFLLQPKLEKASALYGSLRAVTTILFWFYLVGRLVVTSRILNHAVDEESRERRGRRPPADCRQVTRVNAPHG